MKHGGDVPDVFFQELGDERFSSCVRAQDSEIRIAMLKWLGFPNIALCEDPNLRLHYSETAKLQEDLFTSNPATRP